MPNSASQTNAATVVNVIIVGAGPVGLSVALRLAQAGVSVHVMEKDAGLNDAPRAAGYYGAALMALERAKVLEKAIDMGFVSPGLCWRKPVVDDGRGGKRYGDIVARLPFPKGDKSTIVGKTPSLFLPQSKLTKLFFDEAIATGLVTTNFNTELIGIQDCGDFVTATFMNVETGTQETYQASFLVGADGGKSTTRRLLNIPFQGHTWPERLIAIDCLFETPLTADTEIPTSFIVHPIHFGLITPLEPFEPGKKSLYRCAGAFDPHDSRSDEELASKENAYGLLEKMLPGPRPLKAEILRVAPYRIHQLCASTFRRGRCVLAGDAAHLNNPFGAMGLSTGLLDGEALADTLELIINEGQPLELLGIYSDERQRVFQTFTDPVSTWNKLRCATEPEETTKDWLIRLVNNNPQALETYGRHFYDTWRTDMRGLIAEAPVA